MSANGDGRFERRLILIVGLLVMVSMVAFDMHRGWWDSDLSNQQIAWTIGRYGVAGWMINPNIGELVADVVKSIWGRK